MNIEKISSGKAIDEMLPKSLLKEVNNLDNNDISQIIEEDMTYVIFKKLIYLFRIYHLKKSLLILKLNINK